MEGLKQSESSLSLKQAGGVFFVLDGCSYEHPKQVQNIKLQKRKCYNY